MFALGWWTRGVNYNRDVYVAAEEIAQSSGGTYIPELGVIHGRGQFSARYNAMSPAARKEMDRRMEFFAESIEPTFSPPKPSLLQSLQSLFTFTDDSPESGDSAAENGEEVDPVDVQRRIEFFRRLQNGREHSYTQSEDGAEQ
ncbi:hypothetical protein Pla52n_47820 [Stieleria varia]|uniref:Uncharacterized protein n=2 Tax=Stieleria varia TaxID=2528005 RepID=A0A5C6ADZ4_9BACT|nr:hypothetical protein Pla52n_47820 [Stieleria varia]